MALNLSTLTNASTSATVLAEAQTTADFLDSVPILKNLARRSNKGGDAKQTTALNQPKALPYDGKGYLYLSGVSGNYASVPNAAALNVTGDIELIGHADTTPSPTWEVLIAKYRGSQPNYMLGLSNSEIGLWREGSLRSVNIAPSERKPWVKATHRVSDNRVQFFLSDDGVAWTQHGTDQTSAIPTPTVGTQAVEIGSWGSGGSYVKRGQIYRTIIKDGIDGTPVLDVDFTATNVRHGDTKFKCATGQTVTINQSGNDPATVIKKSVLRFDGADDGLQGLFANNIDGGYMFAAFSVLGDGGEDWGRVFTTSLAGSGNDYSVAGTAFSLRSSDTDNLQSLADSTINIQNGMFDDSNGDILHVVKVENGSQTSAVNNAGFLPNFRTTTINSDEFNIGFGMEGYGGFNAAIDLEYLALFPATITDAEAARVVNYINNRNNVFDLKDSLGYYFFDPTDLAAGPVASWNGQIIGSDNDANLTITQTTAGSQPDSNQPTGSGMAVTFNDNNDHLDVPAGFVEPAAGSWQVVGTSLGTFAYKVNANAVTELNLLGNLGSATYRQAGDLYGIILLPETATGADIEAARKLLIDRGAADGTKSGISYSAAWAQRDDIVEFSSVNTSTITAASYGWYQCSNLETFPALDLSNSEYFVKAWQACTALTSFPAGAKLGTAATGAITFDNAWQSSGLTSFSTPLPTATSASVTWGYCSALTEFDLDSLPLILNASQAWRNTGLTSFNTNLPSATSVSYAWYQCTSLSSFGAVDIKNCTNFTSAWQSCTALTSFPAGAKLGTAAENVNFTNAFRASGLTTLPAGLDMSQGDEFASAFRDCGSLTTIGSGVLLGTESINVNFTDAFRSSGLTELPANLDLSEVKYFVNAFYECTSLTTIGSGVLLGTAPSNVSFQNAFFNTGLTALPDNLDLSQGDTFSSAFKNCSSLATIGTGVLLGTANATATVNFNETFRGCTNLAAIPNGLDLSKVNDFQHTFRDCSNLVTLPANLDLSSGGTFYSAFRDCSSLVTFPAGAFDTMGTPLAYCFTNAWDGCSALSGASVDAILDSIEASGQSAPSANSEITITYNTATGTPLYDSVPSLFARGWNVKVNSVAVTNTSATDLIIDSMAISTLSVVSGLSPVYNRLGNPAEYGDNISRIGNLGTDANDPVQTVEAEQPVFRAVGNEADYGDGYLYLDGVAGSFATIPDPIGALTDFTFQVDGLSPESVRPAAQLTLMGQWASSATHSFLIRIQSSGAFTLQLGTTVNETHYTTPIPADTVGIRITRVGTLITYWVDTGSGYVSHETDTSAGTALDNPSFPVGIGAYNVGGLDPLLGTISRAQIWDNGAQTGDPVVDADFRNATHKLTDTDTLVATSGQTVTINGGATVYNPPIAPLHGYLHLSGTAGNYASVPDPIGALGDFVMEAKDVYMDDWADATPETFFAQFGSSTKTFTFRRWGANINFYIEEDGSQSNFPHGLTGAATASIRVTRVGTSLTAELDTGSGYVAIGSAATIDATAVGDTSDLLEIGARVGGTEQLLTGTISRAAIWDNGTAAGDPVLDVNFATDPALESDTSFTASTGQTVTIHQSTLTGDRAKLVHSSEVFYDGLADEFDFTLSSTFTGKTIVASTQGILVADVSRPAGTRQIEHRGVGDVTSLTHLGGGLEQKGVMLLSPSSSPAALTSAFVARGAVKSFAARTEFGKAFRYMGLTSFPTIDISNGVNCYAAFEAYKGTTFPALNFASATSLSTAWINSPNLTSLPAIQAPVCTNFSSAWYGNTALATIDPNANFGESASGVDFTQTFNGCANLVTLPANLNLSKGDDFLYAFQNCSSLVTFPAGAFDTMGTPLDYCFFNAWDGCSALSGASVDAILNSIDTSGQSAPGTGPEISIDYDTGTTAPAYTTLASLQGKGWSIVINGTTLP